MQERSRQTTRLVTGAALSALVMVVMASPASAHDAHAEDTTSDGLIHQLTQRDHLVALVVAVVFASLLVATVLRTRNQAD